MTMPGNWLRCNSPRQPGNYGHLMEGRKKKVGKVACYVSNKNLEKVLHFGNSLQDYTKMSLPVTNLYSIMRYRHT